jgi:hypothetical protein
VDRVGRFSAEQWKEISPYLDQALDLESSARERWLSELKALKPQLAADLRALLATHAAVDAAQFLERSPLSPGVEPVAGQQFGAYTLESLLGRGGMGSVWLARRSDGHFESKVAVKILDHRGVAHQGAEQIRREASLLARQSHAHIRHVDAYPTHSCCADRRCKLGLRVHRPVIVEAPGKRRSGCRHRQSHAARAREPVCHCSRAGRRHTALSVPPPGARAFT